MKYLLDSNIIIDFFRGKQGLKEKIIERLRQGFGVGSIGLAELYRGAFKSDRVKFNLKLIKNFLNLPEVKMVVFGKNEALAAGDLAARLEQKGQKLSVGDTLIAATAKANNLTILTEDKKHFGRLTKFGIKVETV
ncbi:type II toxin-antitoxin system VapC family toxin [Patescibacteria group bacterium]|nr:type II toxin-antitoxin system VapC family toxin [Patescibacteria group bacterium]